MLYESKWKQLLSDIISWPLRYFEVTSSHSSHTQACTTSNAREENHFCELSLTLRLRTLHNQATVQTCCMSAGSEVVIHLTSFHDLDLLQINNCLLFCPPFINQISIVPISLAKPGSVSPFLNKHIAYCYMDKLEVATRLNLVCDLLTVHSGIFNGCVNGVRTILYKIGLACPVTLLGPLSYV